MQTNTLTASAVVGSYPYGSFVDNQAELARLDRQASIGLRFEEQQWREIGLRPGMRVLDAASGPGVITCELARFVAPGEVIGLELNPQLLNSAEERRLRLRTENVSFRYGDIFSLPSDLGSFDVVYARFLFQHLSNPVGAIKSLYSALKPGGKLCIIDVDDGFFALHPEPPALNGFLTAAAECQAKKGGDRRVGRKLYSYCAQVGISNVVQSVTTITSLDLGLEEFLGITMGFKHQLISISNRTDMCAPLAEIMNLSQTVGAWGAVGLFRCVATRGSS